MMDDSLPAHGRYRCAPDPASRKMDFDPTLLQQLNDAQRLAVQHGDGPLIVLAGPGSGKTRVITFRIAHLLSRGILPSHILALTFTNKAAGEMRSRVAELVGDRGPWVGTFHGFCARLLRAYGSLAGLNENFSIYDQTDSQRLLKEIIAATGAQGKYLSVADYARRISGFKQRLLSPEAYRDGKAEPPDQAMAEVYTAYQERLRRANAADFDDLLMLVVQLLRETPDLRSRLDHRYRYLLIDEYQDTNLAQYLIVRYLSSDYPNVMVTGDPDQSIYGWRGATIENILRFQKHFPQARMVRLERNYRSTPNILRAADRLIAYNSQRLRKQLFTDRPEGAPVRLTRYPDAHDEAEAIARRIHEKLGAGYRPRDMAIFYRANYLSRVVERALRTSHIPYRIVRGTAFYQRKEIKDVLAYLQLLINPCHDEAFRRVVNVPARAIGKVTMGRLTQFAAGRRLPLLEAARRADQIPQLGTRPVKALRGFVELIDDLSRRADLPVADLIRAVIDRSGLEAALRNAEQPDDEDRLANVRELIADAEEFDLDFDQADSQTSDTPADAAAPVPLVAFLERTVLVSDQDGLDRQADAVSLMTLHAAKGLEFPIVFIVALEGGILPNERSVAESAERLEEERRLLFVGITRAQDELYLSLAAQRGFGEQRRASVPSSFLFELPRDEMVVSGLRSAARRDETAFGWEEIPVDALPEIAVDWGTTDPSNQAMPADVVPATLPWRLTTAAELARETTPATPSGDDHSAALMPGAVVTHPDYGVGIVCTVHGTGRHRTVEVEFAAGSQRHTFRTAYAPLTIVRPACR